MKRATILGALIVSSLAACGVVNNLSPLQSGWREITLANARTNETFTLADFEGQTVFVHMIAQWCIECWVSQNSLRDKVVSAFADDEDVVFLSLAVEPNASNEELARYADENGFNWMFAVAPREMIDALVGQFGRFVAYPPAMPHFVIAPNGVPSELDVGNRPAQYNIDRIRAAG